MTNEEFQKLVLDQLADLKKEVSTIKGQNEENTGYVKTLLHRAEELDAKFDGLLHNTLSKEALVTLATKEDINNTASKESLARVEKSIDDIGADLSFLVRKAAKHDDDIRNLRKAQ